MTSKHTPGPWVVATHDLSVRHRSEFGLQITAVVETIVSSEGTLMDTETAEANAALIAAAPEMLEALKWLDSIGGLGVPVHDRIIAAIAKATGEA